MNAWQASQTPPNRIHPDDLDLRALLGPIPDAAAALVLWHDADSVLLRWSALHELLAGSPEQADTRAAQVPSVEPVEPIEPVDPARARNDRILTWYDEHEASRPEVAALDRVRLAKLAHASAEAASAVRSYLAATGAGSVSEELAEEISRVLTGDAHQPESVIATTELPATPPTDAAQQPDVFFADPGIFVEFDWDHWVETAEPGSIRVTTTGDGQLLTWPTVTDQPCVLYRVVSSPLTWATMAPDLATLVGVTDRPMARTTLRAESAVAYLSVFAHGGTDQASARAAQPRLIATGQIVWPPTNFRLREDAARHVTAVFTVPPGAHVEVQRRLATEPPGYSPARRLAASATVANTGFIDPAPPLAVDVVYAVYSSIELPGGQNEFSDPVEQRIRVVPDPAPLQLTVTEAEPGFYDLSWPTPGFGSVEVYMRETALEPGFADAVRSRGQLEQQGLTDDFRVLYPPLTEGGREVIRGCASARNRVRTYFVLAHVVDEERIGIGSAVAKVFVPPPGSAEIIERVDSEIVTFAWPKGVGKVEVFQGPRGQLDLDPAANEPLMSLTEADYMNKGGLHFADSLPPNGCSLHLYGVVFTPEPLRSVPVILDYPGIIRVEYRLVRVGPNGNEVPPNQPAAGLRVEIRSDEMLQNVQMCLVQHPNRLPLHPQDSGARLLAAQAVSITRGTVGVAFTAPLGGSPGWVRLFVSSLDEAGSIAILDPDPTYLYYAQQVTHT
ncbi:MAG: hypothetical protein IPK24_20060 [Kineosporiaceae bacterium]|nr:hypothetical protein [Kineosporiaceae bacterium]